MPQKQNQNNTSDYGQKLAEWQFDNYRDKNRGTLWYVIAILICLSLIVYSILTANYLFTFIVFLGIIIFVIESFLGARKKINFAIYEDGVIINEQFRNYEQFKDFWIVYEPPHTKILYLSSRNILEGEVSIPLEDENPVKIREALLTYLRENIEQEDETFVDIVRKLTKL